MNTSLIKNCRVQIFLTFLIIASWYGLPSMIKIATLLFIGTFTTINYIEGFELDTSIELMLMVAIALIMMKSHPGHIYIVSLAFVWGSRITDIVLERTRTKESGISS